MAYRLIGLLFTTMIAPHYSDVSVTCDQLYEPNNGETCADQSKYASNGPCCSPPYDTRRRMLQIRCEACPALSTPAPTSYCEGQGDLLGIPDGCRCIDNCGGEMCNQGLKVGIAAADGGDACPGTLNCCCGGGCKLLDDASPLAIYGKQPHYNGYNGFEPEMEPTPSPYSLYYVIVTILTSICVTLCVSGCVALIWSLCKRNKSSKHVHFMKVADHDEDHSVA